MGRINDKHNSILIFAGSICFAILSIIGVFYGFSDTEKTIVEGIEENATSTVLLMVLLTAAFNYLLVNTFLLIDKERSRYTISACGLRVQRKEWLLLFVILFGSWSPYLILYYPGSMGDLDYFWQLGQGLGIFPLSDHHPIFGSFVFAMLYRIGFLLNGAEGGLFFTCLFQMLTLALLLSFSFAMFKTLKIKPIVRYLSFAFLCLCPMYPLHAMWAIKDSLYTSAVVAFLLGVYLNVLGELNKVKPPLIATPGVVGFCGFVASVYRNGTIAIIVVTIIFAVLLTKMADGRSKGLLVALLLVVIGSTFWNISKDSLNVYPSNFREAVGIPSRQLLRTYELRESKFTENEKEQLYSFYKELINKGVSMEDILKRNNYKIADGIKPDFFTDNKQKLEYIKLWAKVGVHNPELYVNEALRGSYGYWWIGYKATDIYHPLPTGEPKQFFEEYDYKNKLLSNYFEAIPQSFTNNRNVLNETIVEYTDKAPLLAGLFSVEWRNADIIDRAYPILDACKRAPFISIVLVPGAYFCLAAFSLLYLASRKEAATVMWPILLITMMACLSPVNGYMRYVFSVNVMAILVFVLCFSPQSEFAWDKTQRNTNKDTSK